MDNVTSSFHVVDTDAEGVDGCLMLFVLSFQILQGCGQSLILQSQCVVVGLYCTINQKEWLSMEMYNPLTPDI